MLGRDRTRGAADREMGRHDGTAAVPASRQRVQLGQQHGHRHAAGLLDRGGHGGQRRIAEVGAKDVVAAQGRSEFQGTFNENVFCDSFDTRL